MLDLILLRSLLRFANLAHSIHELLGTYSSRTLNYLELYNNLIIQNDFLLTFLFLFRNTFKCRTQPLGNFRTNFLLHLHYNKLKMLLNSFLRNLSVIYSTTCKMLYNTLVIYFNDNKPNQFLNTHLQSVDGLLLMLSI